MTVDDHGVLQYPHRVKQVQDLGQVQDKDGNNGAGNGGQR